MYRFEDVKYKDILNIKDLHIKEHLITSIVGPSGSGKTTFIRLLNKLISPDEGMVFFKDESLSDINSVLLRRKVVMLPQAPAMYRGTIRENLLRGLEFAEKEVVADKELLDILQLVDLSKELEKDASTLSGGESQRLALARVLLMEPEVLLLDEPSSALDDETELKIIQELVNYTKKNYKTLVMVTHSKGIAEQFADEIIRISPNEPVEVREVK